jgi:hypothetical protein
MLSQLFIGGGKTHKAKRVNEQIGAAQNFKSLPINS